MEERTIIMEADELDRLENLIDWVTNEEMANASIYAQEQMRIAGTFLLGIRRCLNRAVNIQEKTPRFTDEAFVSGLVVKDKKEMADFYQDILDKRKGGDQ